MNTKNLKSLSLAVLLAGVVQSPIAQAGITQDINAKMTTMLGHTPAVTSVYVSEQQNLQHGAAKFQPWSGSYWPDINGGIANHYRDHSKLGAQINFLMRYKVAKNRFKREHNKVDRKIDKWDTEKLNEKLSPAEKYDLLLGDLDFSFTNAVMEEADFRSKYRLTTQREKTGEDEESEGDDNTFYEDDTSSYSKYDDTIQYRYWRPKSGSLAYWSGICDGWSPASIYLPRPSKSVTVTGALGHKITFFPDDLKALGAYLFARTNTPYFATMNYKMAGHKCDPKGTPDQDDNGFVKDIRCNDVDAGVWHLTLLNRVGKDKMGFVMDVDNNIKINNHPVSAYSFKYFNPSTGADGTLKNSIVAIDQVKDGYKIRRHKDAKYLVGVKANLSFMYYIWPEENRDETMDSRSKDKIKDRDYVYDLELDANGNILGGEWGDRSRENGKSVKYSEQPDFIWMAAPQNLPYSEQSVYAAAGDKIDMNNPRPFGNTRWNWDGKSQLPADWVAAAKADLCWKPPVTGQKIELDNGTTDVEALEQEGYEGTCPAENFEADTTPKNSVLKSAQPLSHIVYFLFDKARSSGEQ